MKWWKSRAKQYQAKRLSYQKAQQVIAEHQKWKTHLAEAVRGTATFQCNLAVQDDQCAMGKWLYSEGIRDFAENLEFQALLIKHREFHKLAAHTLQLALDGQIQAAEYQLRCGELEQTSLEMYRHLIRLEQGSQPI